jgi:hypothetical protein
MDTTFRVFSATFVRRHGAGPIFDFIEVFYNRRRRHSFLGYLLMNREIKRAAQPECLRNRARSLSS